MDKRKTKAFRKKMSQSVKASWARRKAAGAVKFKGPVAKPALKTDELQWNIQTRIIKEFPEINHKDAYQLIKIFFEELEKLL